MAEATPELGKLPELQRFAMWHSDAGLIVSPLGRMLPEKVALGSRAFKRQDYTEPRQLEDSNVYLAFYPKKSIHEGPLFSDMGVDLHALEKSIVHVPRTADTFKLHPSVIEKWTNLENALYDIITTLIARHPGHQRIPQISWPRWPYLQGYRDSHEGPEFALICAKRSLWAFTMMSACLTFALSLWLGEFEETCFQSAFLMLSKGTSNTIPLLWLETHLRESIVCDLSPGLRTGGFLDPFTTQWRPFIPQFCRARTPIWFPWGKRYRQMDLIDPKMIFYLPPEDYVELAKRQTAHFSSIILPQKATYKHEGPLSTVPASGPPVLLPNDPSELPSEPMQYEPTTNDTPVVDGWEENAINPNPTPGVDRSLIVFNNCDQKPGENWEMFKARMEKGLERRKRAENHAERQSRETREANARGAPGKSGGPQGKCTGFIWEQDEFDKSFYRRTSVRKSDLWTTFHDYPDYQRFYWSHVNQWDFVPHLAPPPGVMPPSQYANYDDPYDDVDWEGEAGTNTAQQPPGEVPWPGIVRSIRAIADTILLEKEKEYQWPFQDIGSYLLHRHGYDNKVDLSAWQGVVRVPAKPLDRRNIEDHKSVLRYLLYDGADLALQGLERLVDFYNTITKANMACSALPPRWDISNHLVTTVHCDFNAIKLERVMNGNKTVYLLRPPNSSNDESSWFIALHSATAVLNVYRSEWKTMFEIARGLLALGIPFRTVVERTTLPPKALSKERSLGLGVRPQDYQMTQEDLAEYVRIYNDILGSSKGRALRLRGGIVGRIAAEVVTDLAVLDGPTYCDEIVARHGDKYYLDDGVSEDALEQVSGVYYLAMTPTASHFSNISWWPRQSTWESSGYASDQWSPAAEGFYQARYKDLKAGKLELRRATKWKQDVRYYVGKTKLFIEASERLAAEFLATSDRVGYTIPRDPANNTRPR